MSARRARTPSSLTLQGGETQSADECFEAVGWLSRTVVVLMDERTVDVEVDVHAVSMSERSVRMSGYHFRAFSGPFAHTSASRAIFHTPFSRNAGMVWRRPAFMNPARDFEMFLARSASVIISLPSRYAIRLCKLSESAR